MVFSTSPVVNDSGNNGLRNSTKMIQLKSWKLTLLKLILLPVLLLQGKKVRDEIIRLPEAPGSKRGTIQGEEPSVDFVVLGESTVAGVGASKQALGLAGQIAVSIHQETGRTVLWSAIGRNGMTADRLPKKLLPKINHTSPSFIVVAIGVNDVKAFRAVRTWKQNIESLLFQIHSQVTNTQIVICGVPDMSYFPALPNPLRYVLGQESISLDAVLESTIEKYDSVIYTKVPATSSKEYYASDGFHPNDLGYQAWGELVSKELIRKGIL